MSDRGPGRTTRQLAALPDGSVYLVHSYHFARSYCWPLLARAGRCPRTAIKFATPDNFQSFVGLRFPAGDVDHAYFALARHRARAREAYDFIRLTYPYVDGVWRPAEHV